ncbi:MAG: FAD:protein FMN transferase [Bacteroidales bacterium]|nr:FAD:protein FMN transferase [Bacteroidales bacterium]
MPKRIYRVSLLFTLSLLTMTTTGCKQGYRRIEGFAQGGTFHIIYSPQGDEKEISSMVNSVLNQIENTLSGYNPESVISRFNNSAIGSDIELNKYFIELFKISDSISRITQGFFDVSAGPLFDYWGFGFKSGESMDSLIINAVERGAIDSIKSFCGMDMFELKGDRIHKLDSRARLNFNAIAQGYTCDVIADSLRNRGVENYLVEVGMEIVCKGRNAKGGKWRIGIDKPVDGNMNAGENIQEIIEVTDCGIVTSGNYRKFFIIDGEKYAHSIDPHTGFPTHHNLLSATIIAKDATVADALATFAMSAGTQTAEEFFSSRSDTKAYLICGDNVIKIGDWK